MLRKKKWFYLYLLDNTVKCVCAVGIVVVIVLLSIYVHTANNLQGYALRFNDDEYVEKNLNQSIVLRLLGILLDANPIKSDDEALNKTYTTFNKSTSEEINLKPSLPSNRYGKKLAKNCTLPARDDEMVCGVRVADMKCCQYIWELKHKDEIRKYKKCTGKYHVVGGTKADHGVFPHMAAIGFKVKGTTDKHEFKCGGNLISERFVLTAGHCTKLGSQDSEHLDLKPHIVRLGAVILDKPDANSIDVVIDYPIQHKQYSPPKIHHDIALLRLFSEVTFTKTIHPACLATTLTNYQFITVNITGWGATQYGNNTMSQHLQVATVEMLPRQECLKKMMPLMTTSRHFKNLEMHQLCAGIKNGGIDTCKGDSGGPIQERINVGVPGSIHRVIGVTSRGWGCGWSDTPAIYTSVGSFIDWIEEIVWPEEYKKYKESRL